MATPGGGRRIALPRLEIYRVGFEDLHQHGGTRKHGQTAEYWIDWTYQLSIGNGAGATVVITDNLGNTVFSGTASGSGQVSPVLTEFRMHNSGTSAVQEMHTPDPCRSRRPDAPRNRSALAISPNHHSERYASLPVRFQNVTARTFGRP